MLYRVLNVELFPLVGLNYQKDFRSIREFTILTKNNLKISMDGPNRWMDNIFIERLWKTVKYEEVYLKAYQAIRHAKGELSRFFKDKTQEGPIRA